MKQQKQTKPSELDDIATSPDIVLVPGAIKATMKAAGAGSRDFWYVPRSHIRVIEGFNVRIKSPSYHAHIDFLASSMQSEGFKAEHPLSGYVARDGDSSVVFITDGHCRLAGLDKAVANGAEIELIPVVIASQSRDLQDLTAGLVLSNTGKPLDPMEKAAVCKRLSLFGWTDESIAKRLNFSSNYVRDLLLLIGSPLVVRQMVAEEKISATAAIQMLGKHGDKAVDMITRGFEKAQASGKSKVTQRFMPADLQAKWVKRSAPQLFDTVQEVAQDPGYKDLSPNLREKIDVLMRAMEELKNKAGEAPMDGGHGS